MPLSVVLFGSEIWESTGAENQGISLLGQSGGKSKADDLFSFHNQWFKQNSLSFFLNEGFWQFIRQKKYEWPTKRNGWTKDFILAFFLSEAYDSWWCLLNTSYAAGELYVVQPSWHYFSYSPNGETKPLQCDVTSLNLGLSGSKPLLFYHGGQTDLIRGELVGARSGATGYDKWLSEPHLPWKTTFPNHAMGIHHIWVLPRCYLLTQCIPELVKGLLQTFPESGSVKKSNCV